MNKLIMFRKIIFCFIFLLGLTFCFSVKSYAADFSLYLGGYETRGQDMDFYLGSMDITGYNVTQGISKKLPANVTLNSYGNGYSFYLNYTLPDDGSTWNIQGNVVINFDVGYSSDSYSTDGINFKVDTTNSTSGYFSGYSLKTATDAANQARDAANSANSNASYAASMAGSAKTSADNAYNMADRVRSDLVDVDMMLTSIGYGVRDTRDYASTAASNASTAASNASTASSRVWDTSTGKSAATLAKEARDNASTAASNATSAASNASNAYNAANDARYYASTAATNASTAFKT